MHAHTASGLEIKKYGTPEDIINDFFTIRLDYYQKRKDYLLNKYQNELTHIGWRRKFIQDVIDEKIVVFKQKKVDICLNLEKNGYPKMGRDNVQGEGKIQDESKDDKDDKDNVQGEDQVKVENKTYDYLLNIKINKFTREELDKLDNEYKNKEEVLNTLSSKTCINLWSDELNEFVQVYNVWYAKETAEFEANANNTVVKSKSKNKSKVKKSDSKSKSKSKSKTVVKKSKTKKQ